MKIGKIYRRLGECFASQRVGRTLFVAVSLALLAPAGLSLLPYVDAAPSLATSNTTTLYDPIVLPISSSVVQSSLARNSHDAQAEYQLLLRAGYQHQEKAAYEAMNRLRRQQPQNPVVLNGYFMAFRMAEGGFNSMRYNGGHQAMSFNHWEDDEAQTVLQKAYKLAPQLWLTYAVDGEDKFYTPGGDREQGLVLLQKAETLAPSVPYTHWLLEDAYTSPPISRQKYEMAAEEGKKALASGAKISNAAFILFQIYSLFTPNQTEEIRWKRKFLSVVPPNVKINPQAKQWLDRYPG